ncbi:filamentous hemagglutinin N-terminal domain-containing protein, partial [Azospirillum sp. TSH64]|uniref:beta strand repeat-containing protein n=1 Tax=Azospirillum sp. TSH64 TaxID=652740 RepID=UPI0018EE4AAB
MRYGSLRVLLFSTVAILPTSAVLAQTAPMLPVEGAFVAGRGGISRSGATMTVDQTTARGIIEWKDFSIGQGATVQVNNGAGATLNRVTGGNLSQILGTLKATGSLYLINPQGVVIGDSGVVVTGGSFVASTMDVLNEHFMAGGSLVFRGDSNATVTNLGKISSTGGDVVLIAREVVNSGRISAPKGTAALASGTEVLLSESGADGERVLVRVGTAGGKVETSGMIEAATAELKAAGGNVYALAGNNGGLVRATGVETRGGRVVLSAAGGNVTTAGTVEAKTAAGDGGTVSVAATAVTTGTGAGAVKTGGLAMHTGTLSANGRRGGSVTVKADRVSNQGRLSADGTAGKGGSVAVEFGKTYIAPSNSTLSARGATDGGQVSVTGAQADSTLFTSGRHDATGGQAGGAVDLFAGAVTMVDASADASGGGKGGSIRVGGDYQGSGAMLKAGSTRISPTTSLRADATGAAGDGGRIIVWSETRTDYYGAASAKAGLNGGDGGLIEVSSHDTLTFAGTGDASAAAGRAGSLLLDPKNIVIDSTANGYPQFQLNDPNPAAGNKFGAVVKALSTGNIVVSASQDDFAATDAGAVYLFNGLTGALISTLTGAYSNDRIGQNPSDITLLANGNFLLNNPYWNNGTISGAGFITWGSGVTGVSGVISAANSLVGTAADDSIGSSWTTLSNSNYLVVSYNWSNGTATAAGAVTWANGSTGITGSVSAANSLVGTASGDYVGIGYITLSNGNYLVKSPSWANGTATSAGAVTWGNGTAGVTGAVSAANSLVGTTANDAVGSLINTLSNGNYIVMATGWANGTAATAGAATWGSGTAGVTGVVSATNSLVGSSTGDRVGTNMVPLTNGNYVMMAGSWRNGTATSAGAVTWGNGTAGVSGVVSATNSLVGSSAGDKVGSLITPLSNGNYVVAAYGWSNGTMTSAGAATWSSGTAGVTGVVSAANSFVGTSAGDQIGEAKALANGNYLLISRFWKSGTATNAGAVTWANGSTGMTGSVSSSNSLVGSSANDSVGSSVYTLSNGNYLAGSSNWNYGTVMAAGAIAWGSGTAGVTGVVSASNSLIGTSRFAGVGGQATQLANGAYVLQSTGWSNGTVTYVGAVTWGSGTAAMTGTLSAANSLIGTSANDKVGDGITVLSNGNYLVKSISWKNGTATSAGAVTWGNGSTGVTGTVSSANSLVGTSSGDFLNLILNPLSNGNYVVRGTFWDNGTASNAGFVTWGNGTAGVTGAVSAANSLVGTSSGDYVGANLTTLSNGNYVIQSTNWANGTASGAGAATWGSGTAGVSGTISAANSLVGTSAYDGVGYQVTTLANGNYAVSSYQWANGTATSAGAVTWGNGTSGLSGTISEVNSIIGSQASAWLGSDSPIVAADGSLIISSPRDGIGGRVYVMLTPSSMGYAMAAGQTVTLAPSRITSVLNTGTAVTLQANNDITINSAITANNPSGNGGALTLQAGRSILVNANITTDNGTLTLIGNDLTANGVVDSQRDAGNAVITMASGTAIDAGTGAVSVELRTGAGKTNSASGDITLDTVTGGTISVLNQGLSVNSGITLNGGTLTASGTGNALVLAADNGVFNNSGSATLSTASGRFLIYSADQPTTTLGGLTPGVLTGKTYATYAPGSVT